MHPQRMGMGMVVHWVWRNVHTESQADLNSALVRMVFSLIPPEPKHRLNNAVQ